MPPAEIYIHPPLPFAIGPKEVVTFWALFISRGPAFEEPKGRKKGDCRWRFNGTEKKYPFVTYQK